MKASASPSKKSATSIPPSANCAKPSVSIPSSTPTTKPPSSKNAPSPFNPNPPKPIPTDYAAQRWNRDDRFQACLTNGISGRDFRVSRRRVLHRQGSCVIPFPQEQVAWALANRARIFRYYFIPQFLAAALFLSFAHATGRVHARLLLTG